MTEIKQLEADLGYVREAVRRADQNSAAPAIYWLWAVIAPIGFALMDFAPSRVPLYWTIAGPLGFVLSAVLGWRHGMRSGQPSRRQGIRQAAHWAGMMLAIFLAAPLVATGAVGGAEFGMFAVLIIALGYFFAGLHFERTLLAVAGVLALGYVGLWFVPDYRWTFLGVLTALTLAATAVVFSRRQASNG